VQALFCSIKTFFEILAEGLKSWAGDVWEIWTDPPDPSTMPQATAPEELPRPFAVTPTIVEK